MTAPTSVRAAGVRYFTLEEANRTLPFVRKIVSDIVEEYRRWREHIHRYELITAGRRAEDPETDEQRSLRLAVDASAERINGFMEELGLVGCVFKGFEEGLVDFHSTLDGRDVYLCWRLGEDRVAYWHDVDTGYRGRRPFPTPAGQETGA
ncbi:MAG TPA: DUF2203 domain-containing protein [Gemmatimonadales bacterium]|nr:DUF2203 domain-containing protein [Gemmatimonadales bacterium]